VVDVVIVVMEMIRVVDDVVMIVIVEILSRRLKLKPRINLPRCFHQAFREQRDIAI